MDESFVYHELLVTYEGPFHPQHSYSRKTFCLNLPSSNNNGASNDAASHSLNTTCFISQEDILNLLAIKTGWPAYMLHLRHTPPNLYPSHSIHLNAHLTIHQHPPLTASLHPRHTAILGGKGGFGTLLKGQSKQAGARQTLDFGACRDLSGRRLRHVNDEIKLRKFHALQEARARGENVDELAALKTESGIRNWHLMVPNWSDGASMSNKGRRKHERQLEREVRGWQAKEERVQREKEMKRMDEEWAINEYVRRGEVEGGRVSSGDAVKEGMLAQLRKKKQEQRGGQATKQQPKELVGDASKEEFTEFRANDKESEGNPSSSHLMTLSGEISVFDIPEKKDDQSLRLQSQTDFATVVVLIDSSKFASCMETGSTGIYIEYTIQSAGLAQIGWIRSPDPKVDVSPCFLPNSDTGDGVGDDAASFGYDGSRGLKFHDGKEIPFGQEHKWKAGDTLGCWCKFVNGSESEGQQTTQIGYTLNGSDLGAAFSISASSGDLSRYFPAVSLNLGEVVDMQFGPCNDVKDGCTDIASLIATEDDKAAKTSSLEHTEEGPMADEDSCSPPKKKPREEQKRVETAPNSAEKNDVEAFDLNSCKSIQELLSMDQSKLKNILLSMGVKCGGTPEQRAERLFSLKGLKREEYPNKVRGKNFVL